MFEQVVVDVLNSVLGDYVANLEPSQLNVGIWQGDVKLRNLRLRQEALDKFELPVTVLQGYLGELTLVIPWQNLKNRPVKIHIQDVYLLAGPKQPGDYNAEVEHARQQRIKQERLKNAELLQKEAHVLQEATPPLEDSDSSFSERLVTKIVDNLQISIENIHVRYEDRSNHPFALGITIAELAAVSTDNQWVEMFIQQARNEIHKMVRLGGLSVYWETKSKSIVRETPAETYRAFAERVPKMNGGKIPSSAYLLQPTGGAAKLTIIKNRDPNKPRFSASVRLDEFAFHLDSEQYQDINHLLIKLKQSSRTQIYRDIRPSYQLSVRSNPRAYWKFCIGAVLREIHDRNVRWTWAHIASRRNDRKIYVQLWKAKRSKAQSPVAPVQEEDDTSILLGSMEDCLSFEDIRFYRSVAEQELRAEAPPIPAAEPAQPPAASSSWFGGWWSSAPATTATSPTALNKEQRQILYDAIEYDEGASLSNSLLPADAILFHLEFILARGNFTIFKDRKKDANIDFGFHTLSATIVQRQASAKTSVTLNDLLLIDRITENTINPVIIRAKHHKASLSTESINAVETQQASSGKALIPADPGEADNEPFFHLVFEDKPINKNVDASVELSMKPLEVFFVRETIDAIREFFTPPQNDAAFETLLAVAESTLQSGLQGISKAGLQFALEEHKTVEVKIDIDAPIFIFPENPFDINTHVTVADLGHLTVTSDLIDPETKKKIVELNNDQAASLLYDKFLLNLNDIQIMVGRGAKQVLMDARTCSDDHSVFLIPKSNLNLRFENSILPAALNFPQIRLTGNLPKLQLNFSDEKYHAIMRLLDYVLPPRSGDECEPSLVSPAPQPPQDPSASFTETAVSLVKAQKKTRDKSKLLLKQILALDFTIDELQLQVNHADKNAKVSKVLKLGRLADATLQGIRITTLVRTFDIVTGVSISQFTIQDAMKVKQANDRPLLSATGGSPGSAMQPKNFVRAELLLVDSESPEIQTKYQNVGRSLTINFEQATACIERGTVAALYDFALWCFASQSKLPAEPLATTPTSVAMNAEASAGSNMRFRFSMANMEIVLSEADKDLALSRLSAAHVTILLRQDQTMSFEMGFAAITVNDCVNRVAGQKHFCLLQFHNEDPFHLTYNTIANPSADISSVNSEISVKCGSLQVTYLEDFFLDLNKFLADFLETTQLVEMARAVAYEQASQMSQSKMRLDIDLGAPVLAFPQSLSSSVVMIANLGSAQIANHFALGLDGLSPVNEFRILIRKMGLHSQLPKRNAADIVELSLVQDLDLDLHLTFNIDSFRHTLPGLEMRLETTELQITTSEDQMTLLLDTIHLITNSPLLGGAGSQTSTVQPEPTATSLAVPTATNEPEWITMDAYISIPRAGMELRSYKGEALHSCGRLSLNGNEIRVCNKSDQSMKLEVIINEFSAMDTRPDIQSMFRELIPPLPTEKKQLILEYSVGKERAAMLVMAVDSTKMVVAPDFLFSVRDFFSRGYNHSIAAQLPVVPSSKASVNESDSEAPEMCYRINIVDAEFCILHDASMLDTDAIVLSINQCVVAHEGILSLATSGIGMSLCNWNTRDSTALHILQDFDLTVTMDTRSSTPSEILNNIVIDIPEQIFLRISYHDVLLVLDIFNRIVTSASNYDTPPPSLPFRPDAFNLPVPTTAPSTLMKEKCLLMCKGIRIVLIDDINNLHLPMFDLLLDPLSVELRSWTSDLEIHGDFGLRISSFNIKNSHWEPVLEPWKLGLDVHRIVAEERMDVKLFSGDNMELDVTHAFLETVLKMLTLWQKKQEHGFKALRVADAPYVIRNQTGYPIVVWDDDANGADSDMVLKTVNHNEQISWRFEDWRKLREDLSPRTHRLAMQIKGSGWETLHNIQVDCTGTNVYRLRPRIQNIPHQILCDVALEGNIKIITVRSCLLVKNSALISMEVCTVNNSGALTTKVQKVRPSETCAIPIERGYWDKLVFRPEADYGYNWTTVSASWKDFVVQGNQASLVCISGSGGPDFRFIANASFDLRKLEAHPYPHMTINLAPPLELENLLPYNLTYFILDRDSNQQFSGSLEKGAHTAIHTVQLDHLLGLRISIPEADYGMSAVTIINNPGDYSEDEYVSLKDSGGTELRLRLKYHAIPNAANACRISIFSPYVLINKTELELMYRASSLTFTQHRIAGGSKGKGGENQKDVDVQPLMFSFSNVESLRGRIHIRTPESEWSQSVSLEAVGRITEVVMNLSSDLSQGTVIGSTVQTGTGKYRLSKIITFTPRFFVRNNMPEDIQFQIAGSKQVYNVATRAMVPLFHVSQTRAFLMSIRQTTGVWSAPFVFNNLGKTFVKLTDKSNTSEILARIEVVMESASVFIVLHREDKLWPYRIDNRSPVDIIVSQANSRVKYKIPKMESMLYTWDEPAMAEKYLVVHVNGYERAVDIQEIGPLVPLYYPVPGSSRGDALAMDIVAEGPTIVLRVSPWTQEMSIYRHAAVPTTPSKQPISPNEEAFQVIDVATKIAFTAQIKFSGIGVSIVDKNAQEIMYCTLKDFELTYRDSNLHQTFGLVIKWIQIDNQLYDSFNPLILYPRTIQQQEKKTEILPTFQLALVRSKDTNHGVDYYKYFTLLLQEVDLKLDEIFLYRLLDFFKFDIVGLEVDEGTLWDGTTAVTEPKLVEDGQRMYFEVIQFQPIKINISFSRSEQKAEDNGGTRSQNPISFVVNVLTMAMGNITDAPIRLNALIMEHPIFTLPVLSNLITLHYTQEVLGQLHKVIGSADVLGNPVGLFNAIGSGVRDVFYEPYMGFVSDRPQDFGIGLAKGTASFLKKTVYGFSDTFSKFTGSVSKGLATATLDEEFQERRRVSKARNRPTHAVSGVTSGASSFARSIVSGVTGIVEQPLRGAAKEGVEGFLKGVGKGFLGVVTKPIVGVFDLASNVSEGIRNTALVFEGNPSERVRLPRQIGADHILQPYNARNALGAYWLKQVEGGRFMSDYYIAHMDLSSDSSIIWITDQRIMVAKISTMKADWMVPLEDVASVRLSNDGVVITQNLEQRQRIISCPDSSSAQWFQSQLELAVQQYNQSNYPVGSMLSALEQADNGHRRPYKPIPTRHLHRPSRVHESQKWADALRDFHQPQTGERDQEGWQKGYLDGYLERMRDYQRDQKRRGSPSPDPRQRERRNAPADDAQQDVVCFRCRGVGHYARDCRALL